MAGVLSSHTEIRKERNEIREIRREWRSHCRLSVHPRSSSVCDTAGNLDLNLHLLYQAGSLNASMLFPPPM